MPGHADWLWLSVCVCGACLCRRMCVVVCVLCVCRCAYCLCRRCENNQLMATFRWKTYITGKINVTARDLKYGVSPPPSASVCYTTSSRTTLDLFSFPVFRFLEIIWSWQDAVIEAFYYPRGRALMSFEHDSDEVTLITEVLKWHRMLYWLEPLYKRLSIEFENIWQDYKKLSHRRLISSERAIIRQKILF